MRAAIGTIALAAAIAACGGEPGAPCNVELRPWRPMPDLEMQVGDTVETALRDHYSPHVCVEAMADRDDVWAVRSADPSAVAVSVSEAVLETVALAVADSVRVSVWIKWTLEPRDEGHPPHEFLVRAADR